MQRANEPPPLATEQFFHDALGVRIDEFLQNIAGQRAYGPHASAARLQAADLAVMADIDYMLNHPRFRGTDAQPIRNGKGASDKHTTGAGAGADAAYIYGQFAKGCSFRFMGVHRYLPQVAGFAAQLAAALAERVSANVYLSPASSEGLSVHFDSHDVFVLQCVGSKRWRLYADDYAQPGERPTGKAHAFNPKLHRPGPVERDVDMAPGDILYLPRGIIHEVAPPNSESLHVTFAVHTLTVAELAHRALRLAAAEIEGLQAPVSHALRVQVAVDDQHAGELAAEVAAALSGRQLAAALEQYRSERRQTRLAPAEHWFGSHGSDADGVAQLAVGLANRVRSLGEQASATAIKPKHQPKRQG